MANTKQKSLILQIVNDSFEHLNAYEVYEKSRKILPNISLGTVYRNLNYLTDTNQIKKLSFKGDVDRYDHILKDNEHDHFICSNCNKIYDLDKCVELPQFIKNNKVMDYELTIRGICEECLKKEK